MSETVLYTIGHSNHELPRFVELLAAHRITAVADVRSSPYSRFNPQFNRESLSRSLKESAGCAYVYLGRELGARREEQECFDESGQVLFERAAQTALFRTGLSRLKAGMVRHRIALLCAEKDPLTCHRTLLVSRYVKSQVGEILHIREDGTIETQHEVESRLLRLCHLPEQDLFRTREELLEEAYSRQSRRVAWVNDSLTGSDTRKLGDSDHPSATVAG